MKHITKYLLFYFLILSPIVSFSQNIEKGFKFLNESDLVKSKAIFDKCILKGKDVLAAKYGLAMIILQEDNKMGFAMAYYNLENVKNNFYKLSGDKKIEYKNYGIDLTKVDSIMNYIIVSEYQRAKKSQNVNIINYYLNVYPVSIYTKKLNYYRDSLLFEKVLLKNTILDYYEYLSDYPESVFAYRAKQISDSMLIQEYHKAYRSLEYSNIYKFDTLYPFYSPDDDSVLIYKNLAIQFDAMKIYRGFNPTKIPNYIKFIKATAPHELAYITLLCFIQPQLESHNSKAAIDTILKYKPYFKGDKRINDLLNLIKNSEPVKIQKLPNAINTEFQEYMPVISIDNKTLYFCGYDRPDGMGGEDIFVSYYRGNRWQKAFVVKQISESKKNEAPMSITADGNLLLIFSNGDIYQVRKTQYGWTPKKALKEINSDYWEADAFITADGKAIIFSSDRPGNVGDFHPINNHFHGDYEGNLDLYVSTRNPDGTWSKPQNLGPQINTPFAERSPFLHPDMRTLYFSSDGYNGIGKLDVYKSYRLSDTSWTEWSEPVNLGYGINSPMKDYSYKISTDGKTAYFAKTSESQADIYEVDLPKKYRPKKVILVYGYITSAISKLPLDASINWENLETGEVISTLYANPKTGFYTITLPIGKDYGLFVSKERFYPSSANIDLRKTPDSLEININFELYSISEAKSGMEIPLKNVFFDFDESLLKKESYPELTRFVDFIKKYPDLKIEIAGHTDSVGTDEYNMKLSQERAEAVRIFLIKQGCNPEQLKAVGYGSTKPVANNKTEENRRLNRRVEFRVIKE